MITLKSLNDEVQEVLRKRDECLRLLSEISEKFPDRQLMSSLREKVYTWYQPDLHMIEFKMDYVEQMMATPNKASSGQEPTGAPESQVG